METQRGRSGAGWVPETPGKPNGSGPGPDPGRIYGDAHGGGLLSYQTSQTRFNTPQSNNEVQNFLPSDAINSIEENVYQNSSGNVNWIGGYESNGSSNQSLGGNMGLQSGNVEMERRVMEGYLPHWSSEGRRSVMSYGSSDVASVRYPMFNSWEMNPQWSNGVNNGVTPNGSILENNLNESALNTMSFGDLLSINESMTLQNNGGSTSNSMFLPNWVSTGETSGLKNVQMFNNQVFNNEEAFRGINSHNSGLYSQGMQNHTIPGPVWRAIEPNSLPSNKHANRSSAIAPPTPDSWQRIQNNVVSENTPLGVNQGQKEQNAFQEQEADQQDKNVAGPVTESSTAKAPVLVESHDLEKGENQGLDLNDTPQKKPRKRRYQPKVIRENKSKRTPIPKTPKPPETQGKRKYNRKPKTNTPAEPTKPDVPTEPAVPTDPAGPNEPVGPAEPSELESAETTAKTCKKSLNFDLNGGGLEEEGQASECQEMDNQCGQNVDLSQAAYDLNLSQKEELREYMSLPVKENIDGSQTDLNISLGKNVASVDSFSGKKDEGSNSSPCASSSEAVQNRGAKRSLSYTAEPTLTDVEIATIIESTSSWKPNRNAPKTTNTEIASGRSVPGMSKRKRTENVQHFVAGAEGIGVARSEITLSKYYCNSTSEGTSRVSNNPALNVERFENRDQLMKTWADISRLKKKRGTNGGTHVRDLASLTGIASAAKGESSKILESVKGTYPSQGDTNATPKSTGRPEKQDSVSNNWTIVPYDRSLNARGRTGSTQARPWRRRGSTVGHITKLLQKLDINIHKPKRRRNRGAIVPYQGRKQNQNALVLYQRDGSMVPFEGPFNPDGKRRQRARVDLDDETTRVWRLLLENIDNEGVNGTDEDKAKWWENERRVFRGRVDSFIARMRLVQGDRRFTPWKGSVLDSVIGVFLTQNVSDHLSSSAFMSMAARFPLKPESPGSTLSEESTSALFVEPVISVIEPEESITWNEKTVDQQTVDTNCRAIFYFDHSEEKEVVNSSETCQRASTYSRGFNINSQTAEVETIYLLGEDKARDDATSSQQSVISSQNSIDSPNQQTVGATNTFSESNSTTPAVTSGPQFNCLDHTASFMGLLKMAEGNIHHQSYSQTQAQNNLEGMKFATEYYQEAPGVSSSNYQLNLEEGFHLRDAQGIDTLEVESRSSDMSRKDENSPPTEQSNLTSEITDQEKSPDSYARTALNMSSCYVLDGETMVEHAQAETVKDQIVASSVRAETSPTCKGTHVSKGMADVTGSTREELERTRNSSKEVKQNLEHNVASSVVSDVKSTNPSKTGTGVSGKAKKTDANWDRLRRDAQVNKKKKNVFDWDSLRRDAQVNGKKPERPAHTRDSLDWDAVLHAKASDIAETIKERGMNNVLAGRIKDLLDRLVEDHGSIDMEWLREIPPDKAKEYLLSFRGLGLKSVECVRLLTLHHMAFPVDTNVGRIAVRLGWVPLQPLPESLQLHLLEMYPILESIQQYLWPRLCKLDQKTLYELHYHMITFGKVFCTKRQPNCNACPLRGECRHFASAFASARYALPGPEDKSIVPASGNTTSGNTTPHVNPRAGGNLLPSSAMWGDHNSHPNSESYATAIVQGPSFPLSLPMPQTVHLEQSFPLSLSVPQTVHLERRSINNQCEPIVEVPASPEQETPHEQALCDIEDAFYEDPEEIPTINLNMKEFAETLQNFMLQEAGMSNALVALTNEAASIPTPKLKNINRLRTEHHVYELPDTHPLIQGMEKRETDDPCSYLLAIWTPGETADSIDPPARRCHFEDPNILCNEETCFYCSSQREANSQTVRGTLLIPTRTAMRGSFPLNGTYFQVNEVFADHASSISPIAVPRSWLWNLPRRTVYFGTSIPTIFKGLSTEDIQHCFWRGYVCVRGFDQKTRAPRPLIARLHFPASRVKGKQYEE